MTDEEIRKLATQFTEEIFKDDDMSDLKKIPMTSLTSDLNGSTTVRCVSLSTTSSTARFRTLTDTNRREAVKTVSLP
ncbi:MAG: hypothetical protein HDQ88_09815 [Clostridia bacterium]|nr:hypothetical protein [Clostridia bacterium]